MKNEFNTSWKSSKQPRKQIKYSVNAPIHLKRKMLGVNLSKDLRKKYDKRTVPLKKGDTVKVMRGKYKGQKGKIVNINVGNMRIEIEGIQVKKQDGSKVNVGLKPSNLQIMELNTENKKRNKILRKPETKAPEKQSEEKETKTEGVKDVKNEPAKKSTNKQSGGKK